MSAITEIPANTARPMGRTESCLPGIWKAGVLDVAVSDCEVPEGLDDVLVSVVPFGLPAAFVPAVGLESAAALALVEDADEVPEVVALVALDELEEDEDEADDAAAVGAGIKPVTLAIGIIETPCIIFVQWKLYAKPSSTHIRRNGWNGSGIRSGCWSGGSGRRCGACTLLCNVITH